MFEGFLIGLLGISIGLWCGYKVGRLRGQTEQVKEAIYIESKIQALYNKLT
jgi:membrane protein DedA with SNARE-associated domain